MPNAPFFAFPLIVVKPRADGKEHKWIGDTANRRRLLGIEDRAIRPWTGRPSTQLRGFSRQLSQPNFIHELLDLTFARSCKRHGRSISSSPVRGLVCDIRQDEGHQSAGGSVSLLSASRVYVYTRGRCMTPEEHMLSNGWCMRAIEDMAASTGRDVMAEYGHESGAKRRRGRQSDYATLVTNLTGNAQSMADRAVFSIPLLLLLQTDLFEFHWDPDLLPMIDAGSFAQSDLCMVIDDDMSQTALRRLQSTGGFASPPEGDAFSET